METVGCRKSDIAICPGCAVALRLHICWCCLLRVHSVHLRPNQTLLNAGWD